MNLQENKFSIDEYNEEENGENMNQLEEQQEKMQKNMD